MYGVTDPVEAYDEWLVEAVEPPGVEVVLDPAEICEGGSSEACAVVTGAMGDLEYLWSTDETTQCITIEDAGEYCVTVTDTATGCVAEACATLIVHPNPTCSIEIVDPPVCPSEGENYLTAITTGGVVTGTWEVIDGTGWAIVGPADTPTIEYSVGPDASDCATFKLTVIDGNGCESTCEIEVCCTGDTFCSLTQGFWGNAGGTTCDPAVTTEELLAALVPPSVIVGWGTHTIEFTSPQDILDGLPAGGPAKAIKNGPYTYSTLPNNMLFKDGRVRNVLVGQVVALTLNLRMSPGCLYIEDEYISGDLAQLTLDEVFCVVPYDDPEACPMQYTIPELLVGKSVAEVLELANKALGGEELPEDVTIGMLYEAASAVNEAFDECATIVACPTEEICCNGCDDDFDGLYDGDDPDCAEICDDGIDNDCDGDIDLDDDDCIIPE
jgi:hypothetical protein